MGQETWSNKKWLDEQLARGIELPNVDVLNSSTIDVSATASVGSLVISNTASIPTDTSNNLNYLTVDNNGNVGKKPKKNVYKYRALIGQSGTDAPYTTLVYEDDFGVLTWTRLAPGVYRLNGIPSADFPVTYPNQSIIVNGHGPIAIGNGFPVNTIISSGGALGGYYKFSTFFTGDGNSYVIIETFTSSFVATEWENVLGEIIIDIEGYKS